MRFADYGRVNCLFVDHNYEREWARVRDALRLLGVDNPVPFINGRGDVLPADMYDMFNGTAPPTSWKVDGLGSYNHFRAVREIVRRAREDGLDSVLLVEDDVQFSDDAAERIDAVVKELPASWDLLYYGANHSSARTEQATANLLRVFGSATTHCLGIRNTMFDPIMSLPVCRVIDWMIGQLLHPVHNCYAIYPAVAVQRPGFSTLQGHRVDYTDLFKSRGSNWSN